MQARLTSRVLPGMCMGDGRCVPAPELPGGTGL